MSRTVSSPPVRTSISSLRIAREHPEVRVIATDPGAAKDFEHFCKTTGHHLLSAREDGGTLIFEIRKAG